MANSTLNASETFLRYARGLPRGKLDWCPSTASRSALSMLQEVAQDPRDLAKLMNDELVPGLGSEQYFERLRKEKLEWTTLEECERVLEFNISILVAAMNNFPDSRLNERVVEPWGQETTFAELAMYQYWNTTWHTGQIAYIQTLLGDGKSY